MSEKSFHQLGKFIFHFQLIETEINELIILLAAAEEEMIRILMNELGFFQKVKTCDVMFSRYLDVREGVDEIEKANFHKVMASVQKIAERRNDLVHSEYYSYLSSDNEIGLIRQNSKLRGKGGKREETEEVLFFEDFTADFQQLSGMYNQLQQYRLKIIDWQSPAP